MSPTPLFRARPSGWLVALGLASALSLAAAPEARSEPVALEGTWFVLIHYTDSATANPDVMRWGDKVWIFSEEPDGLSWSEYSIIVFDDTTGRFETLGRNPRSRVLAPWEPNAAQLSSLASGPRVNSRGHKRKRLRGDVAEGFRSGGAMQIRSATAVGFQENVSIEGLGGLPRFTREDVMGLAGAVSAEGRTRYEVREISASGEMSGAFSRDDNRRGTFRMFRTGAVRGLPKDGRTPNQKAADRARRQVEREVRRGEWDED